MGGRGASSFISKMRAQAAKWSNKALGTAVPKTLSEALGKKGAPLSVSASYEGANPHYSPDYAEFSMNCQRCVVAYELRRRGYDVKAAPTYQGDKLPYAAHTNKDGTLNSYWMGAFKGAKTVSVAASSNKKVLQNIESKMNAYGPGSRAVIRVQWQQGGGHVFNVENVGGKIRYMDAQVGKNVNIREYLAASKPGRTSIVRTDDLKVSERAKKSVTQK